MGSLVDYAKSELKRIGMIDSGDPCNEMATKAILDLIELFDSQGHSGFSASYVANAFNRLARFKPIAPLTGEDDEWEDLGYGTFQNKRYPAVFKDKDGVAYNVEGRVFSDDGEVWYTSRDSRVNITFPYTVPDKPEYICKDKEKSGEYMTKETYKKAFEVACELLNGSILYGYDIDRIYEILMERDGIVAADSYEEYILENLSQLKGEQKREKNEYQRVFSERCM